MVQEEAEAAAEFEHTGDFGDCVIDVVDVFEHEARDSGVEGLVGEGQRPGTRTGVARTAGPFGGNTDTVPRRIDPHDRDRTVDLGAWQAGREPADLAVTAPDVEHAASARQLGGGHRQDLFLVLGIGAVGESVDPPIGVLLPQLVARVGHPASVRISPRSGRVRIDRIRFAPCCSPSGPTRAVPQPRCSTSPEWATTDGWHCFWYADHYMPNTGDESFSPGDVHECWSILPAIAAVTERLRLGPLVAPTSVHHPALLANRAATIDRLSGGRFVLGIGAGWQINEHAAYGIELESAGTRVSRFEESIQIVRSMLDNARTTFHGDFYDISDAPCDPKPTQATLPILVGTGSPRMLRITARHAQEWNTWGAPDLAADRFEAFVAACESVGVDPATKHTSVQAMFFPGGDVAKIAASETAERSIAGSDEQIIDALGRYADIGFDEVIVPDFTLGATFDERLAAYRHFSDDIIPAVA